MKNTITFLALTILGFAIGFTLAPLNNRSKPNPTDHETPDHWKQVFMDEEKRRAEFEDSKKMPQIGSFAYSQAHIINMSTNNPSVVWWFGEVHDTNGSTLWDIRLSSTNSAGNFGRADNLKIEVQGRYTITTNVNGLIIDVAPWDKDVEDFMIHNVHPNPSDGYFGDAVKYLNYRDYNGR